ncbi:MAG: hypothetical protein LQ342_004836 [Letrouitia transgressa]|nr:MAG: hypothetical protein LQ342_004836 [Letrouitia transgressa]
MASLKAIYQGYLAEPNAIAFASDASLNYIPTLTTINKSDAIGKHITAHQRVLRKRHENLLSAVEGDASLCVEVETTIEFITGGGAYLPGLDDNFLADQVVTFPIIHIVQFNGARQIQQIRLAWDQASVLKQVEVIGSRAKNWPIRDGKEQVRLIATSASAIANTASSGSALSNSSKDPNAVIITSKPTEARKMVTGDPHAGLSLFAPHNEESEPSSKTPITFPRAGAKPPQRDLTELFADEDTEVSSRAQTTAKSSKQESKGIRPGSKDQTAKPPPRDYHDLFVGSEDDASPASKARPKSPQKENIAMAPKGGAGRNYQPSRLFDPEETEPRTPGAPSPDKLRKPHPQKYSHFEFSDEPAEQKAAPVRPKTKHQSQWDFEDFTTPKRVVPKIRSQDIPHFAFGEEDSKTNGSIRKPSVSQPRPDANLNFELQDDGTPAGGRRPAGHPRGHGADRGIGIYQSNIFNEDGATSPGGKGTYPLSTVTNLKDRRKDFDPQFSMTQHSPSTEVHDTRPILEARAKVVKMMDAQWEATDASPVQPSQSRGGSNNVRGKENTGIKSAGDGMGGRKESVRSWDLYDESDEETIKFRAEKKQLAPKEESFWDY